MLAAVKENHHETAAVDFSIKEQVKNPFIIDSKPLNVFLANEIQMDTAFIFRQLQFDAHGHGGARSPSIR